MRCWSFQTAGPAIPEKSPKVFGPICATQQTKPCFKVEIANAVQAYNFCYIKSSIPILAKDKLTKLYNNSNIKSIQTD